MATNHHSPTLPRHVYQGAIARLRLYPHPFARELSTLGLATRLQLHHQPTTGQADALHIRSVFCKHDHRSCQSQHLQNGKGNTNVAPCIQKKVATNSDTPPNNTNTPHICMGVTEQLRFNFHSTPGRHGGKPVIVNCS